MSVPPETLESEPKPAIDLEKAKSPLHAFLCGHRGSGKTTELKRLRADPDILSRYLAVYVSAQNLGTEAVHLTHDALLLEIGLALVRTGESHGMKDDFREELGRWGREVVKTFLSSKEAKAEAGAKGNAWLAFFRAGEPPKYGT